MFITNEELETKREQFENVFDGHARKLTTEERAEYKRLSGSDTIAPSYVGRKWDEPEEEYFNNYSSSRMFVGDFGF